MAMLSPVDIKAQKVAYELINHTDKTQLQILKENGYKGKSLHRNTTHVIQNNTRIQHFLKEFQKKADKFYSNIENIADIDMTIKDSQDYNLKSKVMPSVLKANQDLLDRLGHGKIQKFLSVTKKVNTIEDDKEIDQRIAELERKLESAIPQSKGSSPKTEISEEIEPSPEIMP